MTASGMRKGLQKRRSWRRGGWEKSQRETERLTGGHARRRGRVWGGRLQERAGGARALATPWSSGEAGEHVHEGRGGHAAWARGEARRRRSSPVAGPDASDARACLQSTQTDIAAIHGSERLRGRRRGWVVQAAASAATWETSRSDLVGCRP